MTLFRLTRRVHEELSVNVSCSASNISFGLPARAALNTTFLAIAVASGVAAASVNPLDEGLRKTALAADVLTGPDEGSRTWLRVLQRKPPAGTDRPACKTRAAQNHGRRRITSAAGEPSIPYDDPSLCPPATARQERGRSLLREGGNWNPRRMPHGMWTRTRPARRKDSFWVLATLNRSALGPRCGNSLTIVRFLIRYSYSPHFFPKRNCSIGPRRSSRVAPEASILHVASLECVKGGTSGSCAGEPEDPGEGRLWSAPSSLALCGAGHPEFHDSSESIGCEVVP